MADIAALTGWISLVIGEADNLRAKGVLSIGAEGCTVTFAPLPAPTLAADPPAGGEQADEDESFLDPLHDPHSYPGGVVPGYQIDRRHRDEDE